MIGKIAELPWGGQTDEDVDMDYKQFFLQKDVLDTLRLYLDPSETAINRLLRGAIISMPQRDQLVSLRWPMNRKELLQILIKRQWDDESFAAFMEVVKHTQNARLLQTLKVLLKKEKKRVLEEEEEFQHPLKDILTTGLRESGVLPSGTLDASTRNMIQCMIQKRDEEITRLRADLEASRCQNKDLETANAYLQGQMARLESAVADVVSDIVPEGLYPSSEEGLRAILREVKKLWNAAKADCSTIASLEEEKKRLTQANSLLTTQNIKFREIRTDLQVKLSDLTKKTTTEIENLKYALMKEQRSVSNLQSQVKTLTEERKALEAHLRETTRKLQMTEKTLEETRKSRAALLQELKAIDYRIRRLLKTLGMPVDRRMLSQAIEHAGNIVLVRKRQGENFDPNKLQLDLQDVTSAAGTMVEDETDGKSSTTMKTSTSDHSSLGVPMPLPPRRISTHEIGLALPDMSVRRTSLLGLPRMTMTVQKTTTELTFRDAAAAVGTGKNIPGSISESYPQPAKAAPAAAAQRRDSQAQVMLPHIRRRSSLAWKMKTDLNLGGSSAAAGGGIVEEDTLDPMASRKRSVFAPPALSGAIHSVT